MIDLPIVRACIVKWNSGREKHGGEFQGRPLEELFGELIDAINYCDQAAMEGDDVDDIRADLMELAEQVQEIGLARRQDAPVRTEARLPEQFDVVIEAKRTLAAMVLCRTRYSSLNHPGETNDAWGGWTIHNLVEALLQVREIAKAEDLSLGELRRGVRIVAELALDGKPVVRRLEE